MGPLSGRHGKQGPAHRVAALLAVSSLAHAGALLGQEAVSKPGSANHRAADPAAVIDTIILDTRGVFTSQEVAGSRVFRIMNSLHVTTKPHVISHELLFKVGEPYDSAAAAETARNLRALLIFTDVSIDTVRTDGKLAVVVRTDDAWSTKPKVHFSVTSSGTWTGSFGITDVNLLGTGSLAKAWWVKETDRSGWDLATRLRRMFATQLSLGAAVQLMSDQNSGTWDFGVPFYSFTDKRSVLYDGMAGASSTPAGTTSASDSSSRTPSCLCGTRTRPSGRAR